MTREDSNLIEQLVEIGLALSAEKNIDKLLELIVDNSRSLSRADGGTLYVVDGDKQSLHFKIMQNDTMNTRLGGAGGDNITLPEVPLYINGKPNHSNVSSYSALTGKIINISDVYQAKGFDFSGTRKYDDSTGYRSRSMLVIPMKNHENDIIGVLQLLNAQDPDTHKTVPFSSGLVDLIGSLASQAAVALTNAQLIQDLKDLFYAFIKSIATAIDEKSPYTGGHINRVVDLTMMIMEKINAADSGPYKDISFSEDEMEEVRIAAWMHDVGKITTPENVVDKSAKLETVFDRLELIELRFDLITKIAENTYLNEKMDLMKTTDSFSPDCNALKKAYEKKIEAVRSDMDFIRECSKPGEFMADEKIDRIHQIAKKKYYINKKVYPVLTEDEVKNLCIRKGTLTDEERKIIENHAEMTLKILQELPFPKMLSRVPEYAAAHHEKPDGTGYPRGLSGKDLSLQSRVMAVADIFEALTAKDRPYKKPMKLSQAVKIMGFMKDDRHIDPNIYELFINEGLYRDYAVKEMNPNQVDE